MKSLIMAVGALLSFNAQASDWYVYDSLGLSLGGKTDYTIKAVNGTNIATANADQSAKLAVDLGFGERFNDFTAIDFNIGFASFGSSSLTGKDNMYSFMFIPRLSIVHSPAVDFWFGVGLGTVITSHDTVYTDPTGIIFLDKSSTSILFSPRIGVDVPIDNKYFIGFQVSYSMTSYSDAAGTVQVGASATPLHIDVSRKMWGAQLRLGYNFGESAKDVK